ncbi:hypothetical protein TrLO_g15484 [Triparma laevis f. longispina]|uniref:J domain-containing protein n=1 Tax=Triparma laevis f. longispina TaxID=1714387 RepID=A0A9W7KTY5_9STRA|nr:hypothetical protein TrLO_g15484 [Triparma laevis f. longispina]
MDYYSQLGIPPTSSTSSIKKAYRSLALRHHPDKNPADPTAVEKFLRLTKFFDTLKDPGKRRLYDRFGPTLAFPPALRSTATRIRKGLASTPAVASLTISPRLALRAACGS